MASAAEKLLQRMRQSKQGWGQYDLEVLYTGFQFKYRDKGGHRVYWHPRHRELIATVARHDTLAIGYIQYAIKMIDRLLELENAEDAE